MSNTLMLLAAASLLGFSQLALVQGTFPEQEPVTYVESDQHTLVGPSVVRVLQKIKGEITIEPFRIDLDTKTAVADPKNGEAVKIPVDNNISGTGFAVSEDGVFITNAHVVSSEFVRLTIAVQALVEVLMAQALETMALYGPESKQANDFLEQLESFSSDPTSSEARGMRESLLSFVTLMNDEGGVVVLEQGMSNNSLEELFDEGHSVEVVALADNWIETGHDVAVLKARNTLTMSIPAVTLASTTELSMNTAITAYGFPGSTDMSTSTMTQVTVTQGRVTSHKQLPATSLRAYQIDAKVSKGSSGGQVGVPWLIVPDRLLVLSPWRRARKMVTTLPLRFRCLLCMTFLSKPAYKK